MLQARKDTVVHDSSLVSTFKASPSALRTLKRRLQGREFMLARNLWAVKEHLHQRLSLLFRVGVRLLYFLGQGPLHCALRTLRHSGPTGLYVGLPPWLTFALPRWVRSRQLELPSQSAHRCHVADGWRIVPVSSHLAALSSADHRTSALYVVIAHCHAWGALLSRSCRLR